MRTEAEPTTDAAVRTVQRSGLGGWSAAWDDLVSAALLPSPFLRSWWLDHIAGPGATFVLVLAGPRLLGGLAVEEDHRLGMSRLRLMGAGPLCPDHLDLVAARGTEQVVEDAVLGWLGRPGGRFIELDGVAEGARLSRVLDRLDGRRWVAAAGVAPWVELGGDYGAYLAARPSRLRNTVRRTQARLARLGVTHRLVEPAAMGPALSSLRRLHASYWGPSSTFLPSFDRFRAAATAGMARGELVLHQLVAGHEVIAVQAWFDVAGRASFYQSGRDVSDPRWRGAGTVLHAHAAAWACQAGCQELDLLRGEEAYKREWAPRTRRLLRYRVARGVQGELGAAATWSRDRMRRGAGQTRAAPGMPGRCS